MSETTTDKKVVPILLRLPESLGERLETASILHHRGRQEIIRQGLVAELARLEAAALPVTPAELKSIASFKKVTGDASIVPTLSAAMRDSVLREKSSAQQSTAA